MAVPLVEHKLKLLLDKPGCYEMKNSHDKIIYVGKSKDLKHRVRSYFKARHYGKWGKLVSEIRDFNVFYCANDKEAFLQEITLIQKYRPYFNIQLKQGRETYPYIAITKQRDPHMKMTRDPKPKKEWVFGPYPNETAAHKTLDFLQKLYPLRRCHGRTNGRPCLYYHMGECLGACFKTIPKSVYARQIKRIKTFLSGDLTPAKHILIKKMKDAAHDLRFEDAAKYRDLYRFIKITVEPQKIISNDYTTQDIFAYYAKNSWMCISVFYIRQARLMKRIKRFFPIIQSPKDTMLSYIVQFYRVSHNITPQTILVPKDIPKHILRDALHTEVKTPQRGQKRGLLLMAQKNAKIYLRDRFRLLELNNRKTKGAAEELAKAMHIPYPKRIEAFDIADIQGFDNTAADVVFVDGRPNKDLYRKYKLHTKHADENAGMHEVIRRRYTRLLKEHKSMPGLILMDGGKIQVNAALDVLHNELNLNIPVAGMVKDNKHRTNHLIQRIHGVFYRVPLNYRSEGFYLITRVQDEIHRFVIGYHRNVHSRHEIHSELTEIHGVGPRTRNKLFRHFGTLSKIQKAPIKSICDLGIPHKTADRKSVV